MRNRGSAGPTEEGTKLHRCLRAVAAERQQQAHGSPEHWLSA